jgi:4-hydroxybenzoate polyprenyltransferase
VRRRRPRWRAYLLLARVSNLPTVWTNVLAGAVISRAPVRWPTLIALSAAVSILYVAGMFLNDAFDHGIDATARPERPIPAGDVSVVAASSKKAALLITGEILIVWTSYSTVASVWGLLLAAAIVYYDYLHKRDPFGPIVMGLCRGLVYCVAAAATGGQSAGVLAAAAVMTAYVAALTLVAKRIGAGRGYVVPYLIAGISLVDALIVATVAPSIAPWAALGFVLTLAGQRLVPGD